MRFRLLGSSAGKTVPRPFCRCRVCRLAKEHGGRNLRTRTGMQIFLDGETGPEARYHVDLPPDTGHHMVRDRFCLERLGHLLVTHPDEDHFDPIYFRNRKIILSDRADLVPLTIYGNAAVGAVLREQKLDLARLRLSFVEVRPFAGFNAGELEVMPLTARHTEGALNYVIAQDGKAVLLAWDTGWWPDETWTAIAPLRLDAVFMECTVLGPTETQMGGHLDFTLMRKMRARMAELGCVRETTPFITVHIGDNGGLTHEEAEALARPEGITVGYDGLEVVV